jgi:hypothetical protein
MDQAAAFALTAGCRADLQPVGKSDTENDLRQPVVAIEPAP